MRKVDVERFISSRENDEEERQRLIFLFRDRYEEYDVLRSTAGEPAFSTELPV